MRALGLAIATALFVPGSVLAQQVDAALKLGFYAPFGNVVEQGSKADPNTHYVQRLQATTAIGANVVVWTSGRLGIEGSIGYTPSNVAVEDSVSTRDERSSLVLAAVRVIYAFTPMYFGARPGHREWDIPWSFYVGAGVGLANRSGEVWTSMYASGFTSPALTLDVGVRTALGARVIFRMDLEDYVSRAQFDKGLPTETVAQLHNDAMFSASLAYRFVR